MMQGSDINLEISKIICTIYQIPGPDSYISITLLQRIINQNSLVMNLTPLIAHKLILLTEMKFTLYQKLIITVLFKRAQPEILGKKIRLKNRGTWQIIEPQNENHKDLETQYQNESKLQIKEF